MKKHSLTLQCIALLLILICTSILISSSTPSPFAPDECDIANAVCMAMLSYSRYICSLPGPTNFEACRAARDAAIRACIDATLICSGANS